MVTQSLVAVPMLLLYALSILIAFVVKRGKDRERRKSEAGDSGQAG
jgi:sec-independent protein translocase protein TatC